MALTSIKDVDLLIMEKLDDRSLLSLCQTNKNARRICDDENFWMKRSYMQKLVDILKFEKTKHSIQVRKDLAIKEIEATNAMIVIRVIRNSSITTTSKPSSKV